MNTGFTFPQAFFEAQWRIGLHAFEMMETCSAQCMTLGAHMLQDAGASAGARVERAKVGAAPVHFTADAMPRRAVVENALRSLHVALSAAPARRKKA